MKIEKWLEKGIDYLEKEKYQRAIACYKRVLMIEPEHLHALSDIGDCYSALGHSKKALFYYEKALSIESNNIIIIKNLAMEYFSLEKYLESIKYYQKLLLDSKYSMEKAMYLYHIGQCYIELGESEQAIVYMKQALEHESEFFPVLNDLGWIYAQQEVWEQAIMFDEQALSLTPPNNDALLYHLAVKYYDLGNYKQAICYCRRILDFNAEHQEAQKLLSECKTK